MSLYIRTEWELAVLPIVKLSSCHDASRANMTRNTAFWWKGIDPHDREMDQFSQHGGWDELERERMPCGSYSFFYNSNLSLNLRHMLISRGDIEPDV